MHHIFDVDIAKEYGVEQAIVIANFQFWITHNAANNKNMHEGKYWTYNSYPALSLIFPYWSVKQIRRIIGDLVERKVLQVGEFNKKGFDKTNWYSFINENKWIGNYPSAHLGTSMHTVDNQPSAQMGTSSAQPGAPIPYTLSNSKPTINTDSKQGDAAEKKSAARPGKSNFEKAIDEVVNAPDEELPPVAPAPQSSGNPLTADVKLIAYAAEKKKKSLYQLMMKSYWDWTIDCTGNEPLIDGIQGKAMKKLVTYFVRQACRMAAVEREKNPDFEVTEEMLDSAADQAWGKLLNALNPDSVLVEEYYKNQVKLSQIYSNLQNIINQLKNGNPKTRSAQQGPTTATANAVETIYNEFANRNSSGKHP